MFLMCFFFDFSHTKDIHKFIVLLFLLEEFKFMIFYMACLLKFRICFFLAQVTLETSHVYCDNWYHDFFGPFSQKLFFFLTSITFKNIANWIIFYYVYIHHLFRMFLLSDTNHTLPRFIMLISSCFVLAKPKKERKKIISFRHA